MKNATRVFAATFGAIFALTGIEHGIGEILQGNVAPSGIMILSWPETEFFRNLGGEPAMTVIPNLLVTGILAVLISLAVLVWAILFVHKKNGGLILILGSVAMLLTGGGIFPPILLMLIGVVATRNHSPLIRHRALRAVGFWNLLKKLWPWSYSICIVAWLSALLGPGILGCFFGVDSPAIILMVLALAFGSLLLTIITGFAYDLQRQADGSSG